MDLDCAHCERYACRVARLDVTPDGCPMRGPFPSFKELYSGEEARRLLYHSARVEAEGYGRWTRILEVAKLARRMRYRRVGVAYCVDMGREARLTADYLRGQGLHVVLPEDAVDCDPIGQAALMAREGTQFNVLAGMCVGHDALFIRHSIAPVTALVVRDRRLGHNPVAALYTRKGYLKSVLYRGSSGRSRMGRLRGWDDGVIDRIAREVRDEGRRGQPAPCRVEEVMAFARRAGVTHLGLAYCVGFRREARELTGILGTNGFYVASVCCKSGSVPKEELGIRDEEKVRPGRREMTCNPLAQAELLQSSGAELALLMGQCVGHDSSTMAHLGIPAVCVVAKDRVLAHNTAAALYEHEGRG